MSANAVRLLIAVTFVLLPLGIVSCSSEKDDAGELTPDQIQGNLIRQLNMMADQEQRASEERDSVVNEKGWRSPEGQESSRRAAAIDSTNMARLEEIIAKHDWPGRSLVGNQAALAAFLILQHANLPQQEKYLPIVQAAADRGDVERYHLAMLQDRVLMRQDKLQRYGTQLWNDPSTGRFGLYPIEDSAGVDARRAEIGLEPLEDYLRGMGINPDSLGAPKNDFEIIVK